MDTFTSNVPLCVQKYGHITDTLYQIYLLSVQKYGHILDTLLQKYTSGVHSFYTSEGNNYHRLPQDLHLYPVPGVVKHNEEQNILSFSTHQHYHESL